MRILPALEMILASMALTAVPAVGAIEHAPQRGNLDVACTQGGLTARALPQDLFPLRMVFVGGYGQPLVGAMVTVSSADGANLVGVACGNSNQVLMRLPQGRYMATADMSDGPTKTVAFDVTQPGFVTGTRTIVVSFPTMKDPGIG